PNLVVDETQSHRRTCIDSLSPVNNVQMCILWLAGYSFYPVRVLSESSRIVIYNSIHEVMDAIQAQDELQLRNEWLLFSGHYQCYGINVQACVDHYSRFTAIASKCPGGMGDALAYEKWNLSEITDELLVGLYLVGDNAYSNNLLTPLI
ncbi:hypothetical protein PHMEG_00032103, partial [Phytophthora megakarya]